MIITCNEIMPLIQSALECGQCVKMTVNGYSMLPFIYDNDVVKLEPIRSLPIIGDIVLVKCSEERYVIHRIVGIKEDAIFLRGDAQLNYEGPFTLQNILGKVTKSFHNGHIRVHNRGMWKLVGLIWIKTYRVVPYTKSLIYFPRKCASKIFRLVMGINYRAYREMRTKNKN